MATSCQDCPLRGRPLFAPMTGAELVFTQEFKIREITVAPGTILMREGMSSAHLYTLFSGMGLRYKTLEQGERQVIGFVLPGDFIGLQAGVMQEMQHSVEATTAMTLCVFDRSALWRLFRDHPARAYDLTWIAALEEHFLGESLAVLGQMSGIARIARAFIRLHDRAAALGLVQGGRMALPYRQQDLADALGLSLVHTNKTLRRLRETGVAQWRNGALHLQDYAQLCRIAGLDPAHQPIERPLI